MKKDLIVVIDGNSLINRAFYALPLLNNAKGEPTNAVFGFCNMLTKIITEVKPKYIAAAFDLKAPTFRHKMYDGYKATRKPMPEELRPQLPKLKEMLSVMGIKVLEKEGYEADDILGTVSKRFGVKTAILTGDKDALQLIDDTTEVWLTKKGISEIAEMTEDALMRDMNLTPAQIIEYKALCGDASDNIPGVPGVGEKTALALLAEYGNIGNLYENIENVSGKLKDKLKDNKDSAYLSRTLATIDTDVPIELKLEDMEYPFPYSAAVFEAFRLNAFNSLTKRADLFAGGGEAISAVKAVPAETVKILSQAELDAVAGGDTVAFDILPDSLTFAFDGGRQYMMPISVDLFGGGWQYDDAVRAFAKIICDGKILKVCFDAKRYLYLFSKYGIKFLDYYDVKLAGYILDLTVPHDTLDNLLVHNGFDAGCRAAHCLSLYNMQREQLKANGQERLYYDIELKLVGVLFDMEQHGFKIDLEVLESLSDKYAAELSTLTDTICLHAGENFNINSPKQLSEILFGKLGIPYPNLKAKSYSTSVEILEQLTDSHPIISEILRYRKIFKLKSTYIDGLAKLVDDKGYVRTEFKQMLTTTGRLSSVEPNLQNIPVREEEGKALRKMFVADKGNILILSDYSQIELRLLAHISGDAKMNEAYRNNLDIHASTAASVFGVRIEDVTKEQRRAAKAVNFGIIYGISDFGLAQNLGIARYKAKEYITKYFETYPSIKRYMDSCIESAREKGYAETLLGRRRKIPELLSRDYNMRSFGERAAMNMPLQGTAADLIKLSMVNVADSLKGTSAKLILQVHDELIVECKEHEADKIKAIIKERMESALKLNVPLVADVESGYNWLDTF